MGNRISVNTTEAGTLDLMSPLSVLRLLISTVLLRALSSGSLRDCLVLVASQTAAAAGARAALLALSRA